MGTSSAKVNGLLRVPVLRHGSRQACVRVEIRTAGDIALRQKFRHRYKPSSILTREILDFFSSQPRFCKNPHSRAMLEKKYEKEKARRE
jgi:hypothetical protein